MYMDHKKFEKRFLIIVFAQLFLLIGTLTIGANFKALPSWFALFIIGTIIGLVLFTIGMTYFYKVNRNYLRALIALVILILLTLFIDITSRSRDDFYLAWSRGITISADFITCVLYVYFLLGTSDYFKDTHSIKGTKKSKIGAIVLVILFIVERLLSFIASLNVAKQNLVLFSICRFGAWGLQFAIYTYVFVILLLVYIYMKKKDKEVIIDEKTE